MARKQDPPTFIFWKLETALLRGDAKAAEKARAELQRRGFTVDVRAPKPPAGTPGGGRQ